MINRPGTPLQQPRNLAVPEQVRSLALSIALLLLSILSAHRGYVALARYPQIAIDPDQEALFLPHADVVTALSFGYRNALANLLWFNTINYFGRHHANDKNYRWLKHMCQLVTTLDPQAKHVYEFGSTMLAWEADAPRDGHELLGAAIQVFPEDWRLYYLRGFTSMYFLKDEEGAKADFLAASRLPGAHPVVIRLAAKKVGSLDDPQTAIDFIHSMLKIQTDPAARHTLEARLHELLFQRDQQQLAEARRRYVAAQGVEPETIQELVTHGILADIPLDPFGARYEIDSRSGEFRSVNSNRLKATQ